MIAKEPLTAALVEQWQAIGTLLTELTDTQWASATPLPGWRVHDIVSHLAGIEQMLSGIVPPVSVDGLTQLEHVRNPVGLYVERWVEAYRGSTSPQILEMYREITAHRASVLKAMTQLEFDTPTETLSGPVSYGRFMRVRLFDCWFHEQDIRDAVGIAGNETGPAAEYALAELLEPSGPGICEDGGLGHVVGGYPPLSSPGCAAVVPEPSITGIRSPSAVTMSLADGSCRTWPSPSDIPSGSSTATTVCVRGQIIP